MRNAWVHPEISDLWPEKHWCLGEASHFFPACDSVASMTETWANL